VSGGPERTCSSQPSFVSGDARSFYPIRCTQFADGFGQIVPDSSFGATTLMSPSISRRVANAPRTIPWSSAMATRMVLRPVLIGGFNGSRSRRLEEI
jgi:hypothetical protein